MQNCNFSFPVYSTARRMKGASDITRLIYLASAVSGMAGGIVYVARQLVTKDDLKKAKGKMNELMDKMGKKF